MDSLNFWGDRKSSSSGWKQAAKVNCITLTCMSVVLISCLISAISRSGGLGKALFFYDGTCDGGNVSQVNMTLHLLINVVSTLVLASSNFFMQVLNSPSREEINAAHFQGSWLGIGIPSVRNAFRVSKFKTACWICLFISSIPIHLLFNSTIFETDCKQYSLTRSLYPPGGSLVQAGFDLYAGYPGIITETTSINVDLLEIHSGYGLPVNLTEYASKDSDAMKNISTTATSAGQWKRLEINECKQEYINCSGLKRHRNVVLIIDKPGGWIRDEIWHLMDNQTELWDRYVPADQPNHLFYDAQCFMLASSSSKTTECLNNCIGAFGIYRDGTVMT